MAGAYRRRGPNSVSTLSLEPMMPIPRITIALAGRLPGGGAAPKRMSAIARIFEI